MNSDATDKTGANEKEDDKGQGTGDEEIGAL